MTARILPLVACACILTACAGPNPGLTGNDTGGIISYASVDAAQARELASQHCAQYGKFAYATGVERRYGGYYSFSCRFNPKRVY